MPHRLSDLQTNVPLGWWFVAAVTTAENTFYAVVFLAACTSGICRIARDDEYKSIWNLIGVGACAGFLGVFCVSVLSGRNGGADGYEYFYWGIASFVGLLGKEQDRFIRWILQQVFKKFGIEEEPKT